MSFIGLHNKIEQLSISMLAAPIYIQLVLSALVKDNKYEGVFHIEYTWVRLQQLYLEENVPSKEHISENIRYYRLD